MAVATGEDDLVRITVFGHFYRLKKKVYLILSDLMVVGRRSSLLEQGLKTRMNRVHAAPVKHHKHSWIVELFLHIKK